MGKEKKKETFVSIIPVTKVTLDIVEKLSGVRPEPNKTGTHITSWLVYGGPDFETTFIDHDQWMRLAGGEEAVNVYVFTWIMRN